MGNWKIPITNSLACNGSGEIVMSLKTFLIFSYCFPDHPHDHKNKMFEIESVERFGFSGL